MVHLDVCALSPYSPCSTSFALAPHIIVPDQTPNVVHHDTRSVAQGVLPRMHSVASQACGRHKTITAMIMNAVAKCHHDKRCRREWLAHQLISDSFNCFPPAGVRGSRPEGSIASSYWRPERKDRRGALDVVDARFEQLATQYEVGTSCMAAVRRRRCVPQGWGRRYHCSGTAPHCTSQRSVFFCWEPLQLFATCGELTAARFPALHLLSNTLPVLIISTS